jgi:hypothetical protein
VKEREINLTKVHSFSWIYRLWAIIDSPKVHSFSWIYRLWAIMDSPKPFVPDEIEEWLDYFSPLLISPTNVSGNCPFFL